MSESRASVTRVHAIAVPVRDQERALAFYTNVLGFELRRDAAFGEGNRWIEVGPVGGETTVALPPLRAGGEVGVDTGLRLATTDARSTHEALLAQGVDVDELLEFPGAPPMFSLRDPDGNTLVIVEA
jgi:lactoylglutathione lyase